MRFRFASGAIGYDPDHRRLVHIIIAVTDDGRLWQQMSADGPGPWAEIPPPRKQSAPRKARKK